VVESPKSADMKPPRAFIHFWGLIIVFEMTNSLKAKKFVLGKALTDSKMRQSKTKGETKMKKMVITIIALFVAYLGTFGVCAAFPPGYSLEQTPTGFATLSNDQSHSANTSVKMGTVDTDDRAAIVFIGGPQLNTITQLSYWSRAVAAGTFGQLTAYISIYLHTDPGKTYADWVTDCSANPSKVFYIQAEPYYTTGYPVLDTWQLQDAFGATPLKWSSYECAGGGGYDYPSAAPALDDYISGAAMDWSVPGNDHAAFASREYGSLYIAAIKIRMGYGGPWADTLAYVDDVTINDYFENFETAEGVLDHFTCYEAKGGLSPGFVDLEDQFGWWDDTELRR
jgi:hypothetical protein